MSNEWLGNEMAINMGSSTKAQLDRFIKNVRNDYPDISVRWTKTAPSICLNKKIWIHGGIIGKYPWEGYHQILHEFAHIKAGPGHGQKFHKEYARLIRKYLVKND